MFVGKQSAKCHTRRSSPSTRRKDERGAALVEFALILPVLAMLVFGILTGGAAYEQKIAITQAAREGARYGASLGVSQAFTSGTWASNTQQVVVDRATGDLDGAAATVCVSLVEGSSGDVTGVYVVGPTSNPATPKPQANYTTNQGALGSTPTPCDTNETYPTTGNDKGRRVQVRASRAGKLEAVGFTATLTLTAKATSRFEATTSS